MMANERLRVAQFKSVTFNVTVGVDGRVELEISEGTGKPETDRLILNVLKSLTRISPPPDGQIRHIPTRISWKT
jgi:outer membrane biosynthesis protein TonB